MANFVPKSVVKSAVRTLAAGMTLAEFTEVVDDILTNNPFGCTDYESGGATVDGVTRSRESYTARFAYEDTEAVTVGTIAAKCPTVAAYNSNVTTILATAAIGTAMGGTVSHITEDDTFSAVVKCHDANGEIYNVAITRSTVAITGYEADAILAAVETWADTVPQLA